MVFAVGDDDDGLAYALLLGEAVGGHLDGPCHVGALCGYHRWRYVAEKHLCRHIVAGDGQLDESVAGEDYQANLVVGEVVDKVLDHHLAPVKAARLHVFGKHGVAYVHGNDGFYSGALLVAYLGSHLRPREHDHEQRQHSLE